jgi:hypothetical protein
MGARQRTYFHFDPHGRINMMMMMMDSPMAGLT